VLKQVLTEGLTLCWAFC